MINAGLPIPVWTAIGFGLLAIGVVGIVRGLQLEFDRKIKLMADGLVADHRPKRRVKESLIVRGGSWEGMSKAEMAQFINLSTTMISRHGHWDKNGLLDDMKNHRPLNSKCWLCGELRFRKGLDIAESD